jgi:transposase
MARAFGVDLRERVLGAAEEGISVRQAAARFEVGISTAIVWVRRFRESGETAARKQGKPRGSKLDSHEAFLLGLVKAQPDITLEEIRAALLRDRSFAASLATIWRFFDGRGITFKKNRARSGTGARGRGASAQKVARKAAWPRS